MKHQIVNEADVFSAACTLSGEGESVSARRVRDRLGRGSMSTVLRHLQTWREQQRSASAELPELPEPVRNAAHRALNDVWTAANAVARDTIDEIRSAANRRNEALSRDFAETLSTLQQTEFELGEERETVAELRNEVTDLQQRLVASDAETRTLREQLETVRCDADAWRNKLEPLLRCDGGNQ